MECPLIIWRLYKFIVHLITGKSEIERICYNDELRSLERTKLIEKSINNSKQLVEIKRLIQSEFDAEEISTRIVDIKKMNKSLLAFDSKVLPNLIAALEPITLFIALKQTIKQDVSILYDKENKEHEAKLEELWDALKPNIRRSGRLTSEWGDIGFQGKDPATDFRGMGILGLDNLHQFSIRHSQDATDVLRNSTSKCVYPFAITGINITALLVRLMETDHFKDYFYKHGSTREQFHFVYAQLYKAFDEFYQTKNPVNIMSFGAIMKEFQEKVSVHFHFQPAMNNQTMNYNE
ncbi:hypothetical protein CYY_000460 [Polysphondylium violaceum]|uniref:ELMO domain-containing protein n=1 Tax=Polysphondylium violaceum TaxID=133409 RepID=A0A8J4V2F6_9MYCE|nr:hypothetical protein CYY_000460 [Polysphondylium violaceum]